MGVFDGFPEIMVNHGEAVNHRMYVCVHRECVVFIDVHRVCVRVCHVHGECVMVKIGNTRH